MAVHSAEGVTRRMQQVAGAAKPGLIAADITLTFNQDFAASSIDVFGKYARLIA